MGAATPVSMLARFKVAQQHRSAGAAVPTRMDRFKVGRFSLVKCYSVISFSLFSPFSSLSGGKQTNEET
ncbi:hypothetical protein L484_022664 [Morus notabilis]|uniref:Uncharacterized protein n=1 Tax=Morus notabilis TaxID=981085 RepID=W9RKT9_9ROSA|nr:hypothetical protein L484_022664 [Morus notabilis]